MSRTTMLGEGPQGNALNPYNLVRSVNNGSAAGAAGGGTNTDYAGQFGNYLSGLKPATGMGYDDMTLPGIPNQDLTAQQGQIASGADASAKTAVGTLARNAGGNTSNPMFQYMASMARAGSGAQAAASQVNLKNQTNQQNFQNQQSNYNLDLSRRTAANSAMQMQNQMTLGLGNLALGGGQLGLDQTKTANSYALGQGQLTLDQLKQQQANTLGQGQLTLDQLKQQQANAVNQGNFNLDRIKTAGSLNTVGPLGSQWMSQLGFTPSNGEFSNHFGAF